MKANTQPKKTVSVNFRKALAGFNVLKGMSQKQALVKAGFSPSTARTPKASGLHAVACVEEAKKLDPDADPSTIALRARKALGQALSDPAKLKKARIGELARTMEVTERYFGGDYGDKVDARTAGERLAWLKELTDAYNGTLAKLEAGQEQNSTGSTVLDVTP